MVDLVDTTFIAMTVVTVGGAIMSLEAREIIYGAIGLAASFFGVASLFFLLDSPFVAAFQIIVYIGAVAILILFTVMLVREGKWFRDSLGPADKVAGLITAFALVASLLLGYAGSSLWNASEQATAPSFVGIGQILVSQYSPVLEVLALVLAASVLGAIALAKVERGEGAATEEDKPAEPGRERGATGPTPPSGPLASEQTTITRSLATATLVPSQRGPGAGGQEQENLRP